MRLRDEIAGYLRQRGGEVFIDYQRIRPGDSFPEQLQREIVGCDYFLLLLSSQSIDSKWVNAEVQLAFNQNKPIIPVKLEPVNIALSRFWNLLHIEQVDFTHGMEGTLNKLALAIGIMDTPSEPSDSVDRITLPKHVRLPFEPETVLIPTGSFLMGSTAEQFEAVRNKRYRELVEKHEPQQQTITLPEYQIGKYPVIVGEYRVFIEQGGYRERRWWTEAGWQQLKKDDWTEPSYWGSSIWTGDDRLPVVGVSWYETVAYCHWLSEITGIPYRLPSEAEWEKAARGTDGRAYPWGNKWRKRVCNTREERDERTLQTTPVGKFSPAGDSPNGVVDMSGNVQEWGVSRWSERYVYPEDIDLAGNTMRVHRGGSWLDYLPNARCAYRDGDYPDNRYEYRGFRVVSAFPASS